MSRASRSLQEEVVAELSTRLLGAQALFLPSLYGSPAKKKEPADVVWVAGRCAILMYMMESRGSFEKKKQHNLRQLHGWLRAWEGGASLDGKTDTSTHSFSFHDIDDVIGISVVDGGEVWCEYHPEQVEFSRARKLTACASLTSEVIRALIRYAAGPRDLIYWLDYLRHAERRISADYFAAEIQAHSYREAAEIRKGLGLVSYDPKKINETWVQMRATFSGVKQQGPAQASAVAADLLAKDITWFGAAYYVLAPQVAPPGEVGALALELARPAGPYHLRCAVFAHGGIGVECIGRYTGKRPGIALLSFLEFGPDCPWALYLERPVDGQTLLQQDIERFKTKGLARPQ